MLNIPARVTFDKKLKISSSTKRKLKTLSYKTSKVHGYICT